MNAARIAIAFLTLAVAGLPLQAQCGCEIRPCQATTLETVTLPETLPVPPRTTTFDFAAAVIAFLAGPALLLTMRARLRLHPCAAR